jgi:hypothetical protein
MKKTVILIVCLLFVSTLSANPLKQVETKNDPQAWLEERYREALSIRPGMSRADLKRVFIEDGGLQTIPSSRYVLKSCAMIKVDVVFDVEYGLNYKERPDGEIKIKEVSKPYLEHFATD